MQRRIIIDTDPGQDDALAILLALASPELDVLGITAVAGNVPLDLTSRNARGLVELAGRTDVPVRAGADGPLERELVTAEHVHGKTGLDGHDLAEPTMPLAPGHGAEWIADTVLAEPEGSVTLVCLGPLTDAALALRRPGVAERLEAIVLMGGGYFEGGNITPMAEFNIFVDPEAADAVLRSGVPITMAPLDVTHKALITRGFVERLHAMKTRTGAACAGWLDFFERFDVDKYGSEGGPLHDPCTIAWLIAPKLFTGRDCFVAVETQSALCLGATVIDWWGVWPDRTKNAHVLNGIDAAGFFDLLADRLQALP